MGRALRFFCPVSTFNNNKKEKVHVKTACAYLQTLNAEEVTARFGDLLEKQMNILRDKKTGTLRALFNVLAFRMPNNGRDLRDIVLQKNRIEKIQGDACYNYLPEILAAVEARGSASAEKLKRFYQFERDVKAAAKKMEKPLCHGFLAAVRNYFHHVAANVEAAKLLP